MEFSLFSRWGPRRELINQCRCGVVCGDFLYWACGDRWRSRGNSTVTNIYIQKSSYFVARSLFISGVELLFSATAHPLAGENALLMYRKWRPGQTAIVEQLLCGLWAPPYHSNVPISSGVRLQVFLAIWTPWGGWFYWVALGSAGLGPVRALKIHHYMLLLMTPGAPFQCLQLPVGCDVFLCLPAVVRCGGWWNEEEIWKPAGRQSSNILKKEVIYKLHAPLNRKTKSRDGTKQIF